MRTKSFEKWNLIISKRMIRNYQMKSFGSFITEGERGTGKSVYNLKATAYGLWKIHKLTEEEAWMETLNYIVCSPKMMIDRIFYNLENEIIDFAWILDDASVHFGKYLFFQNVHEAALLQGMFDTIRVVVSNILINTPNTELLFNPLQTYNNIRITLYKEDNEWRRKAVAVKFFRLPSGTRKFRKIFEDKFSCYAPDWFYREKYMPIRKKYLRDTAEKLEKLREKLERKKQIQLEK